MIYSIFLWFFFFFLRFWIHIQWNLSITNLPATTFELGIERCRFIQVELTKISYIGTLFIVWFIQDSGLFQSLVYTCFNVHVLFIWGFGFMVFNARHFQQYFNYIVAVSFIGGGSRRKPQTYHKSLTNFTT